VNLSLHVVLRLEFSWYEHWFRQPAQGDQWRHRSIVELDP